MKVSCKSRLSKKMVLKSIEAFTYALETFNKPTITYRVESFSYLICNAWELLLKAHWIETKGKKSIYFKEHPNRTINLEKVVKETFTNDADPIRKNLEVVIDLRNTSTHFITEEYEELYAPFFQACVLNYIDKIDEYFDIDMNVVVHNAFLTISTYHSQITPDSFKRRYGIELYNRYIKQKKAVEDLLIIPNDRVAISIDLNVALVKDAKKADLKVAISNDVNEKAVIYKDYKDINKFFPFNQKRGMKTINDRLERAGIPAKINAYAFQLISNYFHLYDDKSMCYQVQIDINPRKMFSNKMIDFIFNTIKKDPKIVSVIKNKIKKD